MHIPDDISLLIEKHLDGSISTEESARLNDWYTTMPNGYVLTNATEDEERLRNRLEERILTTIARFECKSFLTTMTSQTAK